MTRSAVNLNRPVHLARRDAYFERAMDILCQPMEGLTPKRRLQHVELLHGGLRRGRDHAFLAARSERATAREVDFHHFLELKLQNVASAIAMIQHQLELNEEEGFLSQFLEATPEEGMQPAQQFERRADDILEGLWHMLRQAHATYFELRNHNLSELLPEEQSRYHRAYAAASDEAKRRLALEPHMTNDGLANAGRTSDPAPGIP